MASINVAILGVGNCASALVQGLTYYEDADPDGDISGLMNPVLGGYYIHDIEPVCAFDVDQRKVDRDLSEAIFAEPNCATEATEVDHLDAPVYEAPELDGRSPMMDEADDEDAFRAAGGPGVDPVEKLIEHDVDVLVNFLPVGSQKATERWMQAALEAGVSPVNCIPVFVASNDEWATRFDDAGVPVLGDDIKSQVGATITHRVLSNMFENRGVDVEQTYQLNVGGNTDFLTLQDSDRLDSKRVSKTKAVRSQLDEIDDHDIKIGPSDYVPFLDDNKVAFIRMQGQGFLDAPVELEMRLSVEDSPNSAGVVIDAIRCAKIALDRELSGPIEAPSSYFFKAPPRQFTDEQALAHLSAFADEIDPAEDT
jgi:myo-inositol-1-phosphate synthase